jgi:prepilin-type N-terminal cleavage/methylation domain-containing protein
MRGATLVELLMVLLVLGVMAGVSSIAVTSLRPLPESERRRELDRARAVAIRSGSAVTVDADNGSTVRFLPDGRALGAGVDPFTGEVLDAAH